jgi:nicotinamide mononucleotide transporter
MLERFVAQVLATTVPEWIAVVSAVLYLVLVIREHIACWLFAAISSATYIYLFASVQLYMESALNLYYLAMAGYGFYVWRYSGPDHGERPITTWPPSRHVAAIVTVVSLSAFSWWLLARYTDAALPFFDSLTTFGALWATFLVARKVFENWWYWLAIDAGSIALYLSRDLYLTSLLFAVYLALIPVGIRAWKRSMQRSVRV